MAASADSSGPSSHRPVHIVYVGAGAVGCFYASRMHHPSQNIHVSLIARSNYAALAASGVELQTHSFGTYTFRPHAVFPSVAAAAAAAAPVSGGAAASQAVPSTGWDFVVVTTKALPDRADDSATIAPLVGPHTTVVLIQNGVGVEDPYRRRFPETPIVSAVTVVSAEQVRPAVVVQNRWTRVHLGPYTDSAPSSFSSSSSSSTTATTTTASPLSPAERLALTDRGAAATDSLVRWWAAGGVRDAEPLSEAALQTVRWHKLCINAAFNPSAVLCGGRGNADMAADPALRAHLAAVMREIWDAAPRVLPGGRGFGPELATPDRILRSSERNRGARPSMLVDWEAGRPLELEVILGNPVRIAKARGVEMPRLQSMYALLRSMQAMRDEKKAGETRGRL